MKPDLMPFGEPAVNGNKANGHSKKNGHAASGHAKTKANGHATTNRSEVELVPTPLLPPGFTVPASRWTHPSRRMRQLLKTEPYLFGPGGYGNIFNVQRTTELYVNGGVAAAHIEDQVLPKRCGHIGGKALIPVNEMVGKLRMARNVADDCGNPDFVIIARTDGLSAMDAPESSRGMELAVERGLRYMDTGIPDLLWCEFPTSDREPVETFAQEIRKRFPEARFAFNWSSSFKWYKDPNPTTFAELGEMGFKFLFITLGAQHANAHGVSVLLQEMSVHQEQGYIELQKKEGGDGGVWPSKSQHFLRGAA